MNEKKKKQKGLDKKVKPYATGIHFFFFFLRKRKICFCTAIENIWVSSVDFFFLSVYLWTLCIHIFLCLTRATHKSENARQKGPCRRVGEMHRKYLVCINSDTHFFSLRLLYFTMYNNVVKRTFFFLFFSSHVPKRHECETMCDRSECKIYKRMCAGYVWKWNIKNGSKYIIILTVKID